LNCFHSSVAILNRNYANDLTLKNAIDVWAVFIDVWVVFTAIPIILNVNDRVDFFDLEVFSCKFEPINR